MKCLQSVMVAAGCAVSMSTAVAQSAAVGEVSHLVASFRAAEQGYDAPALAKLISSQYVEVSPAGEVDAHDRFLGFYTPDKKAEWPPMSAGEEQVRVFGDTAIDVLKFTYTMAAPGGATRMMEVRASFVAQRESGTWKLIGAQYTGIRPMPVKPVASAPQP